MDPERWKRVEDLLQAALERPAGERDAFLRRVCAGDEAIELEVRSLVASQQRAGSFLENPAIEVAALAIARQQSTDAGRRRFPGWPDRLPLPRCGKVGRRRDGRGLQGRGYPAKALCRPQVFVRRIRPRSGSPDPFSARSARRLGIESPEHLRGLAYLDAHEAARAAAEFQKILDHRGIVVSDPIGALARLQLGRALALSVDKTNAKAAYQDFLTLWKDADAGIPIFKQAKAE